MYSIKKKKCTKKLNMKLRSNEKRKMKDNISNEEEEMNDEKCGR